MSTLKARPEELDLALYSGDGVTIVFEFTNDADDTPYPTIGEWTAEICVANSNVVTAFTITNDEAAGIVKLSLTGEQVTALWPKAVYDLQQVAPGAEPRTWYRGTLIIEGDVSG